MAKLIKDAPTAVCSWHIREGGRRDTQVMRSRIQADRHDQVDELPAVGGLDQPGSQGTDQLKQELLGLDAFQPVAKELRIEADLKRLPGERDRQALAGLADVRSLG